VISDLFTDWAFLQMEITGGGEPTTTTTTTY